MKHRSIHLRRGILLSISVILYAPMAGGQTLQRLHSFDGANGAEPVAGLAQGSDGNFYGTTSLGGANNLGTVFRITPGGELTTLVTFTGVNGATPLAALVQASDGNFYGTTYLDGAGDSGTVFRMAPTGALTTLVTFDGSNGLRPGAELIQGTDGNLYGTAASGIFRMSLSGALTTLNSTGTFEALVEGADGNFYGTTIGGGNNGDGTVFRITPTGVFTTITSFHYGQPGNHGPAQPEGVLVQGIDGNFYGTTSVGGSADPFVSFSNDYGTVFKVTPTGVLTVVASFNETNGIAPLAGLVQGSDGNFYGTTTYGGENASQNASVGTVFMVTPAGVITSLFSFNQVGDGFPDGARPEAGLVFGSDGNLYGTTRKGGANDQGTVFRLIMPTLLSFAGWAAGFGLSGGPAAANADPDGDGLANAVEYILGGNPTAPTTSGRPTATISGGNMIFTFPRDDASETQDVTLTVESGSDLVAWPATFTIGTDTAASSASVTIAENATGPDTITVIIPVGSAPRLFARLKVTIVP